VDDRNIARPSSSTALKILVVDDKPDNAKMLSLLLQLDGHDARAAFSGAETIKTAEDFTPDVVFLDIGLPVMDGYEIAERLRKMTALENTMLVALTGYGPGEGGERYRQAGFDYHLLKPAEPEVLKDLLLEAAERKAANREL